MPDEFEPGELNLNNPTCLPAGVIAIGSAVPDEVLTNDDFEKMLDTNDEWITSRTGIKKRHIAPKEVATSDLALEAAREALLKAGMEPEELEMIIVATLTPDSPFPATACLVQDKLGAGNIPAFDLGAGCSGFVYGLSVALNMVGSGTLSNAMVIGAEVLSRVLDYTDRNTCVLFGDGAGAAIVKPVEKGSGVISYALAAYGGGAELLHCPAGGSRFPASHETVDARLHYAKMNGRGLFTVAVKRMPEIVEEVVASSGYSLGDIDCMVPHQANRRIIESACKNLNFPMEKVFLNLHEYGNTSAASIPLALAEAEQEGFMKNGDLVLLVSFGTGVTWSAMLLRWGGQEINGGAKPQPIKRPETRGGQ